jgi:paraquat-inducible protein B
MAKQANRMMIGGFVVLALIILAVSLVVFGSGKFFKRTQKFVLYFDESVKGLDVGAPVLFKGVAVGSVTSIIIVSDPAREETNIPVIIEIDLDKFQVQEAGQTVDPQKNMPKLIKLGLRARLGMQSLITGKLLIEIDVYPDTPANLKNINQEYVEIPTIPSTTSRLAQALDKLDLEEIQQKLESALAGIDNLFRNPDLTASIKALRDTLQNARKFIARVDRQVDPLAKDAKKTVKDIGKLANNIDGRVDGLATSLDKTLSGARGVISEDAPLVVELENTLREISAMSRSIRLLADYLEQHPETLIRGKKKSGGKKP